MNLSNEPIFHFSSNFISFHFFSLLGWNKSTKGQKEPQFTDLGGSSKVGGEANCPTFQLDT